MKQVMIALAACAALCAAAKPVAGPSASTPPSTTSVTVESSLGTARLTPVNASVASIAAR